MLIQDSENPIVWNNSNYSQGAAGTFAIVIGVSRYDYLEESETPAPETYGLGQLQVSALTAFRFFSWLKTSYRYTGRPLARCWLLLSPSDSEREFARDNAEEADFLTAIGVAEPATIENFDQAIRDWYIALKELPQVAAEKSAAVLFFSGHGIEITQDKQILLPSDYLQPPGNFLNDAISTSNLRAGLASLKVRDQLFFLDACRNDNEKLRMEEIEGRNILTPSKSAKTNPNRNAPVLYGSASGTQAWAPDRPADGISLFGQALVDGLKGTPDIAIDCQNNLCTVRIYPLHTFVRSRVLGLLREYGATVEQYIPLGGSNVDNPAVTELDPAQTQQRPSPPPPPLRDDLKERLGQLGVPEEGWNPNVPIRKIIYHRHPPEVFGSETMTGTWQRLRVYSFERSQWYSEGEGYRIYSVRRDDQRLRYKIDLKIQGTGDHWVEVNEYERRFATFLPGDSREGASPRYLLSLYRNPERTVLDVKTIASLSATLSLKNKSPLREAAMVWNRYSNYDIHYAANSREMTALLNTMFGGYDTSQLARVIAWIVLIRGGRWKEAGAWIASDLIPSGERTSDSIVLSLEGYLLQKGYGHLPEEKIDDLLTIESIGLPRTAEGLGYAVRQVEDLLDADRYSEDFSLSWTYRDRLTTMRNWLRQSVRVLRAGSLLTALVGPEKLVHPGLNLVATATASAHSQDIEEQGMAAFSTV